MHPRSTQASTTGRDLRIVWQDGSSASIPAAALWSGCRSAVGTRRRMQGEHLDVPVGLRITNVTPIGSYGVNIAFSDGHDRGVYPWALLAELASRPTARDFIMDAAPGSAV